MEKEKLHTENDYNKLVIISKELDSFENTLNELMEKWLETTFD